MRKLRIAHFTVGRCNPDSANGIDKTVYFLAREQARLGVDVGVFSLTQKPPIPIPGVEVATFAPRIAGSLARRLGGRWADRLPFAMPPALVESLKAWMPDILHLHFLHLPLNVYLARRVASSNIRYCVTIHGALAPSALRRNRLVKQIYGALSERQYLRSAAFIHAVSRIDHEGLAAYGVSNRVVIAPNGVDLDSLSALDHQPNLREQYPQFAGKRILLFLGRLDMQQKGLDVLLRGFSEAGPERLGLILAGPDWRGHRGKLAGLAAQLGIESSVVFPGPQFGPAKLALLHGADVFVHPSRWEAGIPFSLLEAASTGRPCLTAPAADPEMLISRYEAGWHSAPEPSSLTRTLQEVAAASSEQLARMGRNARRMVEDQFSWGPIAQRLIDAYRTYGSAN